MMHKDVRWNCSFSLVTLSWHPEHGILSFGQAFAVISSHAAMCWCPSLGHLSYFWAMFEVIVGIAIVALPQAGLAVTFNRQILGRLIHCHIYPQLFFSERCATLGT